LRAQGTNLTDSLWLQLCLLSLPPWTKVATAAGHEKHHSRAGSSMPPIGHSRVPSTSEGNRPRLSPRPSGANSSMLGIFAALPEASVTRGVTAVMPDFSSARGRHDAL
jgi:hypothetical protein